MTWGSGWEGDLLFPIFPFVLLECVICFRLNSEVYNKVTVSYAELGTTRDHSYAKM